MVSKSTGVFLLIQITIVIQFGGFNMYNAVHASYADPQFLSMSVPSLLYHE